MERVALKWTEGAAPAVSPEMPPAPIPPASPEPESTPAISVAAYVRRWLLLRRRELRTLAIGTLSIVLFLLAWHLLTKYRVNIHIRFVNVPSPEMVWESLTRASRDSKFLMHVLLSCRRIFFGFMIAAVVAVPLGLVMGRFRLVRDFVFPVSEVLRPIPAIAWVPMSIMLWPSNEEIGRAHV